jgi:uncharacterized protein YciI
MKKIVLLTALLSLLVAQRGTAQDANPRYDQKLAESLGADPYGMRQYYFVILKTGANQDEDNEKKGTAFKGHMDNITHLAKEGKLIIAGPLGTNDKQYRGIFIFAVKTKEEAELLVKSDPAVAAHYLDYELYPWYGSAALPKYLEYHEKIEKQKH